MSAKRVFEQQRAQTKGIVYPTLDAKVAVVEAVPEEPDPILNGSGA